MMKTEITTSRLAKRKRLYVYVNEDEYDFFKDLAKLKTGKNNLSMLVRVLLNELAEQSFRRLVSENKEIANNGNLNTGNVSGSLNHSLLTKHKTMYREVAADNGGFSSLRKKRFPLRLPSDDMAYFDALAKHSEMSVNACLCTVLRGFRENNPKLFNDEIAVLHHSNYQLSKLGVNLNQIAKQLNSMSGASLATSQIRALRGLINEHCQKVEKLLRENQRRHSYDIL